MDTTAFQKLSYGVYVCTTWANGKPVGCIANSTMQITSSPATVAVSINKENYTHECIEEGGYFAIGVLGEKSDPQVIGTFGFRSGKDFDKFADTPYTVRGKLPVPDTCMAYLACKVVGKMDTPTHTVFLGEVFEAETLKEDTPMTYAYYHKVLKGKTAAKAPTYVEEKPTSGAVYVCTVCGYTYDGDIPFEELPADWVCPLCGVGKDMFEKQ